MENLQICPEFSTIFKFSILKKTIILWLFILTALHSNAEQKGCPIAYQQYKDGQYLEAIQAFNICAAANPNDYYTIYNRGMCYEQMEELELAEKDFWKAFQMENSFIEPIKRLAERHLAEEEFSKAEKLCKKAIEQSKGKAPAIINYNGWLFFIQEKYRLAYESFSRAIEIDSLYASAYNNRGSARYLMQDVDEASTRDLKSAFSDYNMALKLDSTQEGVYRNMAYIKILLEEFEEALVYLNKIKGSKDPIVYLYLAKAERGLGNINSALKNYSEALTINKDLYQTRLERAEIYLQQKNWPAFNNDINYLENAPDEYKGATSFLDAKRWASKEAYSKAFDALKIADKLDFFENRDKVLELKKTEVFNPLRRDKKYQKWLKKL